MLQRSWAGEGAGNDKEAQGAADPTAKVKIKNLFYFSSRVSKVKGLGDYVTLSVSFSELRGAAELL
jgi:hypothetical protein